MARFADIPKFTRDSSYNIDMSPEFLMTWLAEEEADMGLELNPDFQRGHVWTQEQQIAYIEYIIRGGMSGRDLYFNCPWWHFGGVHGKYRDYVCVDGLQRITAWRAFLNNEIPVFDTYYREFTDRLPTGTMRIHVNDLKTRREVLGWYIEMNAGGTPHSKSEIARVQDLLDECI